MAHESFRRKLAAILSAGVEGYSRLVDDDEEATVCTFTRYRSAITDLVQQFRGRVVDSPGDNILAEFVNVVDSVNCAVEIQRVLAERNAELPDKRKMEYRIGVSLGDVIEEGGRIYGDGVNIAARVETFAEAGGVCISGRAYDHVENKLEFEYEYQGEQTVKNISRPIRIYRVLSYPGAAAHRVVRAKETSGRKWRSLTQTAGLVIVVVGVLAIWQAYMRRPAVEPASIDKMALPLPNKPSIAVLPFDNVSDDPKQAFFSDGLTEEIISSLSKTGQLLVIALNSTFAYKGKPVEIKQVAEELGVRYVLEGSVRKSEDRVRITARLIDATTGHHLGSERYDRELQDIFAVQDEITMKILTAMEIQLTEDEQTRMWAKRYKNLDVYLKRLEAQSHWRKGTVESQMRHGRLAQEIIDMAPGASDGYFALAGYHWWLAIVGKSSNANLKKALELAQKAISLDESHAPSYGLLGSLYLAMRKYDQAIAAGKRSVELDPNGAQLHGRLGQTLYFAGRSDEAIEHLKKGIRRNPFPASWYYTFSGHCYLGNGRYEDALTEYNKALQKAPKSITVHVHLAIANILLGREEQARILAERSLEIAPLLSVSLISKNSLLKDKDYLNKLLDAMRKAGFPEHPPLPLPD